MRKPHKPWRFPAFSFLTRISVKAKPARNSVLAHIGIL